MGKTGLAYADFLAGREDACSLVGRAESWASGGQGHAPVACLEADVGSEVFRWPVNCWVDLCPIQLKIWSEVSQHWCLLSVGWGQFLAQGTKMGATNSSVHMVKYSYIWLSPVSMFAG